MDSTFATMFFLVVLVASSTEAKVLYACSGKIYSGPRGGCTYAAVPELPEGSVVTTEDNERYFVCLGVYYDRPAGECTYPGVNSVLIGTPVGFQSPKMGDYTTTKRP